MLSTSPATTVAPAETNLLQELAAEMLGAWQTREWGAKSDENFADFSRWLADQVAPPPLEQ